MSKGYAGFGPYRSSMRRRVSTWLYNAAPWAVSFILIGGMVGTPWIVLAFSNWSK